MCALDFEIFLNFTHFERLLFFSRSAIRKATCIYSDLGDNSLVPLRLWWEETALKDKNGSKYFVRVCLVDFLLLHTFYESLKTPRTFLFWKESIESFHKYCPTAFSPAISVKFVLEWKVRNSTWKISNIPIFHISVVLNTNFYKVKGSRATYIRRKFKFQEVWTELRSEFYFLRQSFTKYFEANLWNRVMWDFYVIIIIIILIIIINNNNNNNKTNNNSWYWSVF